MIRVEYDDVTKDPKYVGWALPGALVSNPVWRIARPLYSGGLLIGMEWAGGIDGFIWVWNSRDSLSYVAGDFTLNPEMLIVPSGTRPGSTFNVGYVLTDFNHDVLLNGIVCKRGGTGQNEYTFDGTTITLGGDPVTAEDYVVVRYKL